MSTASNKKPGRKAHVGRPSNAELAARTKREEMKNKNPKSPSEEKKTEDAGKDIMKETRGFFGRMWDGIKSFANTVKDSTLNILNTIWGSLKNIFEGVIAFFKALADKVKVNLGASRAKNIFAIILLVSSIVLGGQYVLAYFTLSQIAIGAAIGCVVTYGVARATMPKDLRDASEIKVKDIFAPSLSTMAA